MCGDGILVLAYEEWDDGNHVDKDGWNRYWQIEADAYWTYNANGVINSACSEICGDGKNIGISEWYDGNTVNGDGWSSEWKVESDFLC